VSARAERAAEAEENDMNTVELQRILGYLNLGLAIAHDSGVSLGHFGSGDFIQLAQTVNDMLLHSVAPGGVAVPGASPAGPSGAVSVVAIAAS
jgi:hypothetical protein